MMLDTRLYLYYRNSLNRLTILTKPNIILLDRSNRIILGFNVQKIKQKNISKVAGTE